MHAVVIGPAGIPFDMVYSQGPKMIDPVCTIADNNILITGIARSGKSTNVRAMMRHSYPEVTCITITTALGDDTSIDGGHLHEAILKSTLIVFEHTDLIDFDCIRILERRLQKHRDNTDSMGGTRYIVVSDFYPGVLKHNRGDAGSGCAWDWAKSCTPIFMPQECHGITDSDQLYEIFELHTALTKEKTYVAPLPFLDHHGYRRVRGDKKTKIYGASKTGRLRARSQFIKKHKPGTLFRHNGDVFYKGEKLRYGDIKCTFVDAKQGTSELLSITISCLGNNTTLMPSHFGTLAHIKPELRDIRSIYSNDINKDTAIVAFNDDEKDTTFHKYAVASHTDFTRLFLV